MVYEGGEKDKGTCLEKEGKEEGWSSYDGPSTRKEEEEEEEEEDGVVSIRFYLEREIFNNISTIREHSPNNN